jgi:hypothetical protein
MDKLFLIFLMAIMTISCSSPQIRAYKDFKPQFRIDQVFSGDLKAHGLVKDRSGQVLRLFDCDIKASWQGSTGTLDETFRWSDGEVQKRVWTLNKIDDQRFTGTAHDVIGVAQGEVQGNALRMRYTLRIPRNQSSIDLSVDDWMHLTPEGIILNRSELSKFGFRVGEVLLTIIKAPAGATER